jgi:hypothetical protein
MRFEMLVTLERTKTGTGMYIFEELDSKSDSRFHLCVEPELELEVLKK